MYWHLGCMYEFIGTTFTLALCLLIVDMHCGMAVILTLDRCTSLYGKKISK